VLHGYADEFLAGQRQRASFRVTKAAKDLKKDIAWQVMEIAEALQYTALEAAFLYARPSEVEQDQVDVDITSVFKSVLHEMAFYST
jgi:hypothetical protein